LGVLVGNLEAHRVAANLFTGRDGHRASTAEGEHPIGPRNQGAAGAVCVQRDHGSTEGDGAGPEPVGELHSPDVAPDAGVDDHAQGLVVCLPVGKRIGQQGLLRPGRHGADRPGLPDHISQRVRALRRGRPCSIPSGVTATVCYRLRV